MKLSRSSIIIGFIGGASALLYTFAFAPVLGIVLQDPMYAELEATLQLYTRASGAGDLFQNPLFWFVGAAVTFVGLYLSFLISYGICRLIATRIGLKVLAGFSALTGGGVAYGLIVAAEIYGVGILGRLLLIATLTVMGFAAGVLMSATAEAITVDQNKTKNANSASPTIVGEA